jgi:tryptophan-rich sensory protein
MEGPTATGGRDVRSSAGRDGGGMDLRSILASPIVGFAPWNSDVRGVGPGRFEVATGLALALSLLVAILGYRVAMKPKLLDLAGILFFGVLLVVGLVVTDEQLDWLDNWAGELSNIMIALVASLSIAIRQPFTLQYAREQAPRELWDNPAFLRVNYVITAVWTLAFVVAAIAGYIGDAVLDDPNNVWTGWIVQIAALILAARFTGWYPGYVRAAATGEHALPTLGSLLIPVTGFLVPAGIISLVATDAPWWVGVGLVVIGAALTNRLRDQDDQPDPRRG